MQTPPDPSSLVYLLFAFFFFGALIWLYNLTRPRGMHGIFLNDDEGEQNASNAEIQAQGGIESAFINKKKGKQDLRSAKIISGASSGAADSEVHHTNNILLQLIAYLCYLWGRGKYPPDYKGKKN